MVTLPLLFLIGLGVTHAEAKGAFLRRLQAPGSPTCDAFSTWPSVDNEVTCGNCRALVATSPYGGKCDTYCQSFGHVCVEAAEEQDENCEVKQTFQCSEEIAETSDMLCTCQVVSGNTTTTIPPTCAPFSQWPNVDNGVSCGSCTALVETAEYGGKCDVYCSSFGHACVAAAEEVDDNCEVKYSALCGEEIKDTSDMLCTCDAVSTTTSTTSPPKCSPFSHWPNLSNNVSCGSCTALVETEAFGGRCDAYCRSFGHVCLASAEEMDNDCQVKYGASCDAEIKDTSDMLCTCQESTCNTECVVNGESFTCRARIEWLRIQGLAFSDAMLQVNTECDAQCACSAGDFEEQSTAGDTIKVMSYNTEYKGYHDGRLWSFGQKIREVDPAICGIQECQNVDGLAQASGYQAIPKVGNRNPILYNPDKVSYIAESAGYMSIPRDNYANRYVSFAKFRHGNSEFWAFNTHLPHNHGAAASRNTHARIAQEVLQKRRELGAEDMPTVVTGDMNPFASNGASEGSFESNLEAAGFTKAYQARGNPGFVGLDKIFSSPHWIPSNGADQGTGRSDHPAIAVDLTLQK